MNFIGFLAGFPFGFSLAAWLLSPMENHVDRPLARRDIPAG